jgi:hypothetical protein
VQPVHVCKNAIDDRPVPNAKTGGYDYWLIFTRLAYLHIRITQALSHNSRTRALPVSIPYATATDAAAPATTD